MRWIVVAAAAPWLAAFAWGAPAGARSAELSAPLSAALSAQLTAEQIVEKNVAARGGLEAWRKIDAMIWIGHLESEHAPAPSMPFVMEQKRPNKTRFEIDAMGKRSVRVFDGAHGWIMRPGGGAQDVKVFTPQEVTFAFRAQAIDGPLIDYQAKGNTVALEGVDEIEGHKAYRLKVQLASGETDHVWVDTGTFLDIRYDRPSYGPKAGPTAGPAAGPTAGRTAGPTGAPATVSVFYRDYRTIDDVQIPAVVETAAARDNTRDRMVIERILLNPKIDEHDFAQPGAAKHRGGFSQEPRSVPQ